MNPKAPPPPVDGQLVGEVFFTLAAAFSAWLHAPLVGFYAGWAALEEHLGHLSELAGVCIDAAAATSVAEQQITGDGVKAIMGADCSGVTGAILSNVALPNGVVMISPSATSPGLSHQNNEDEGLFFRTAPSDARQGVVMTEVIMDRGINEVAVTYTNNDYGKGLADSFQAAFEEAGGTVTINAAHEDGKGDYSAEVGALASAGGDILVVAGYIDQGGSGVVRAALDTARRAARHGGGRYGLRLAPRQFQPSASYTVDPRRGGSDHGLERRGPLETGSARSAWHRPRSTPCLVPDRVAQVPRRWPVEPCPRRRRAGNRSLQHVGYSARAVWRRDPPP